MEKSFVATTGAVIGTSVVPDAQAAQERKGKIYQVEPNSLIGQVHVITGASSGLGLESAKRLAVGGATVVLTARTAQKGARAIAQVQDYLLQRNIENNEIYAVTLDLDDLDSVRSFPKCYNQLFGSNRTIDVLMNNAGVGAIPTKEFTKDGFERTFQSNTIGPFLLTALLFSYLNRNGARIINVSSYAHNLATIVESGKKGLDFNNLNSELEYRDAGWGAYETTKLENILFTGELQRRADLEGLSWLTTVSLHPGVVGTDIWRSTYVGVNEGNRSLSLEALVSSLFYRSVWSVEEGANTQVMLAALNSSSIAKGRYYDEYGRVKQLASFARDSEKAKQLWEVSEQLTGADFRLS